MKILKQLDLENVVFIDIETTPVTKQLERDTPLYDSWKYKMDKEDKAWEGDDIFEQFAKRAALFPEFSKIVCITIGKIKGDVLKVKSFAQESEKELITDFCNTLNNIIAANKTTVLAGHAIKGFDIPFIMRRCMVNQVEPPNLIDTGTLKPWEVSSVDTLEIWKGTGFNSASLINIAVALDIPSPKDEIEGADVYHVYYNTPNPLQTIQRYCEKDVLTVANVVRRCRFENLVTIEAGEVKKNEVGRLERIFNTKKITAKDQQVLTQDLQEIDEEDSVIAKELINMCIDEN